MTKIELAIHDDAIATINKLKAINDAGVEIIIPVGSVLFENILNLKLIDNQAEKLGIKVQYITNDDQGNSLLDMVDGKGSVQIGEGTLVVAEGLPKGVESEGKEETPRKLSGSGLPKLSSILKLPKVKFRIGLKPLLVLVVLGTLLASAFFIISKKPRAHAKIIVEAQQLTRSVTVRVIADGETSAQNKTLKGKTLGADVEENTTVETTGEKIVGEKADGKAKLVNGTKEAVTLKAGTKLVYKESGSSLAFETTEEVTIEALSLQDPTDPVNSPWISGEAEVEIQAVEIGGKYNLDSGNILELGSYKRSEVVGETSEDLEGGSSKTIKVVAEEDITKASEKLSEITLASAEKALKNKKGKSERLIEGSLYTTIVSETPSHKVGEEAKELSLNQKVSAVGLTYLPKDLDKLLDEIVADLIPKGYVLSEREREVKADVMGNSTDSVLSATQADIQVTLKTYVVPDLKEDTIKEELRGKSLEEARKFLGGLGNIKTYEFGITPSIPFLQKVPNDIERISVEIERE